MPISIDDLITIGIVAVLAVVVVIAVIRKAVSNKKAKAASTVVVEEKAEAASIPALTAPGSAGELKLHNVAPKTAAIVMAIVANKLGKPLNELRFISIKEVD